MLDKLNETGGESEISELVEWALPIQQRHFADVKDGSLRRAGDKDPYDESWLTLATMNTRTRRRRPGVAATG